MSINSPIFWYATLITPIVLMAVYLVSMWVLEEDPREKLLKDGITKGWEYFLEQPGFERSNQHRPMLNFAVLDRSDTLGEEIREEILKRDQRHLLRTVLAMNDEDYGIFSTSFNNPNSSLLVLLERVRTSTESASTEELIEQILDANSSDLEPKNIVDGVVDVRFDEWWDFNLEQIKEALRTLSTNFFNDVSPDLVTETEIYSMLKSGSIIGYFTLPEDIQSSTEKPSFNVSSTTSRGDVLHLVNWYRGIVTDVLHRRHLEDLGIEPQIRELLLQKTTFATNEVEVTETSFVIPEGFYKFFYFVLPILLWIVLFASSIRLVSNVSEEKSSKLADAILSNLNPIHLLDGKLWGTALTSLTVAVVWLILISLFLWITGSWIGNNLDPAFIAVFLRLDVLLNFVLFMVLAYALYGYVIVAISSRFSRLDSAVKTVVLLLMVVGTLTVVPTLIVPFIPISVLQDILSIFPLSMPFVMVARSGSLPGTYMYCVLVIIMVASVFGFRALFGWLFAQGITDEIRSSKVFSGS